MNSKKIIYAVVMLVCCALFLTSCGSVDFAPGRAYMEPHAGAVVG